MGFGGPQPREAIDVGGGALADPLPDVDETSR